MRLELENSPMKHLVRCLLLFAVILGLAGCKTRSTGAAAPPAEPPPKVKAGDLLKEYGSNAVAADKKYKGKIIQVTGKFGSVQKAPILGYSLELVAEDAAEGSVSSVQCFLSDAAEDDVAKLQAGQAITVQGTCDGQYAPVVKLSKCTIVK
jgi:hypothetical protein